MRFWKDLPHLLLPSVALRIIGGRALDTIFPPQSLLTGAPSTGRNVEAELWGSLSFLDEPCCQACGFPFDYDLGAQALCGRCAARRPAYSSARAAFAYDDVSRRLVLDFKHGGRVAGVPVFTAHMMRAGRSLIANSDLIIPVPLHPSRLLKRRYNQSAILARAISKASGVAFTADCLMRSKATQSQGGKSASGRRKNVSGAFALRPKIAEELQGKSVLLIDDVFTTGATLDACARALKKGGADQVYALTLARVVKPQDVPT